MILGVTGHRPDSLYGYDMSNIFYLKMQAIFKNMLIERHCTEAWFGCALGTDMIFAKAVLSLKQAGYDIKLHAAIPCDNHGCKWPKSSQDELNCILAQCDSKVIVCPGAYAKWKMDHRNHYIVDRVDEMIAVYAGMPSGTAECIAYANETGVPVTVLSPNDILLAEVDV